MAGIMVFLPEHEHRNGEGVADELIARGAGDLLDVGVDGIATPVVKGPTGSSGTLITFYPGNTPREYKPDAQTWKLAPPVDGEPRARYWVGYVTDSRPFPEELQRRSLIDGEPTPLCDNRVWIVPVAEFAPKRLSFDENGAEVSIPEERHRRFVDWANAIYQHFMSDGFAALAKQECVVTIPGGLSFASLALSKNYRVNAAVVDLLGLVGQVEAFEIARIATGMSIIERALAQKKSSAV